MIEILKIYLPLYLVVYLLLSFVVPSYRVYKQTGINPIVFGKKDNAHDYIGFIMKIIIILLILVVSLFAINDNWYFFTSPIVFLQNEYLVIIGLVFIHISLLWIAIAQYQMRSSWRIGIDEKNKTELVTRGVFSLSRNPIFLGMILSILGLFLIIPNAVTFFCSLTSYFIIQIQIRLEEEFLEKQHTKKYIDYKNKTRRLI
jgi:protein-S-isoprenylcysteine O-methyltransferase Ste14